MLGCTQYAIDDGDQANVSLDGLQVPHLILVEPFGLTLLVINFNGPAVASNARDARRLPVQAVRDKENRAITQVRLAVIDDQPLPAKVLNAMRGTVAVVLFLLSFVTNRERFEDGRSAVCAGRQMFLFQPLGKCIQALRTLL